jgi:hypothetical protein
MFRVVLKHRDDGTPLIQFVAAGSAEKAKEKMSKFFTFYKVNSVEKL